GKHPVGTAGVLVAGADDKRADALSQQIEKLERAVIRHMRAYALLDEDDSGSLEAEYKQTLAALRQEKADASAELAELRSKGATASTQAKARGAAPAVALGLIDEWDSLPVERLNSLLRKVVRELRVSECGDVIVVPVWAPLEENKASDLG
ncbi:hypothetical protein, partial [Kitasatospora sp. NPDC047058]|uniref:hypothetical protein n=1 Tax=Kitasatospora sp. NPDC047058 TaxID=3155620 RepID=UPI0033C9C970